MLALRYLYAIALVAWLGGMLTLGALAAPTVFAVLEEAVPASGRALGGAVFGAILRRFHLLAYGCAAAMLVSLLGRALWGAPPPALRAQLLVVSAMLGVALYSGIPLTRQIERLQREAGPAVSALREDDPRRLRFNALHRRSTMLMLANVAGGLVLLYWQVRE